jgi:DNA-binding NarL/FixJ family response regulator
MRRTKEILRLRFDSGLGLRQIARSLSISVGTVHDYLPSAVTSKPAIGGHFKTGQRTAPRT